MPNALFDLDGTLCDPREGIVHGFRHAFDVLKLPFPGEAAVVPLIGKPLLACFHALGVQGPLAEQGAHHFQAFFEGRGFAEGRLYDGVLDCLHRLKAAGWGVAIASAKPTFAVRFVAEGLGILPWVDGLYGCGAKDLAPVKGPIVAAALAGQGWSPSETLMIGDRDQDRDAAAEHGLGFVAAAWGFGGGEEHAGALAVAASPHELMELLQRLAPTAPDTPAALAAEAAKAPR